MTTRKKFEATLERAGGRLHWTIIRIPFDVTKVWGKRGHRRVIGTINGFPFRTSLFPDGQGNHFLVVNKQMQKGSGAAPERCARFEMEPDEEPRTVEVPAELARALNEDRALRKYYDRLNDSTRREIARHVIEARQPATRTRRAGEIAERLMQVMEAEIEPPPILKVAFLRNPEARIGWDRMPPSHKRAHLFGIFYYKRPEAQARRVEKAIEMMMEYAARSVPDVLTPR